MFLARSLHCARRGHSLLRLPQTIIVTSQAGNFRSLLHRCQQLQLPPPPRQQQQRRYYTKPPRRPSKEEAPIPSKLLVYHAGTGRIVFLACLKLTTILLGAYQLFLVLPMQFMAPTPPSAFVLASVVAAGLVPVIWVWATTRPFVTHIHLELPAAARSSRADLVRFVRDMPPFEPLVLTTFNPIGKPHYSTTSPGKLVPTKKFFGLINYERADAARENRSRRWYMLPAASGYYIQPTPTAKKVEKQGKNKDRPGHGVDTWVWDAIVEKLQQRERWLREGQLKVAAKPKPKSHKKR